MRIVCDCDLVIAPADIKWLDWLNAVSESNVVLPQGVKECHYDLSHYFPNFEEKFNIHPHAFWDTSHLYDTIGIIKGADDFLNSWVEGGHTLAIASHTKGGHFSSKYRYVKRRLNKVDFGRGTGNGFFATKEKYLLPADIAIDDRAENLVLFPDETLKIYFNTIYMDDYLEELKTMPNVLITSIEDPWKDVFNAVDIYHK